MDTKSVSEDLQPSRGFVCISRLSENTSPAIEYRLLDPWVLWLENPCHTFYPINCSEHEAYFLSAPSGMYRRGDCIWEKSRLGAGLAPQALFYAEAGGIPPIFATNCSNAITLLHCFVRLVSLPFAVYSYCTAVSLVKHDGSLSYEGVADQLRHLPA